jgi:hypothetical protein
MLTFCELTQPVYTRTDYKQTYMLHSCGTVLLSPESLYWVWEKATQL